MFNTDFSKINARVFISALGQALFSLSLGMGAMITYGSYFPKGENMPVAGVSVAFFDTLIALLGGFMIFPALFAAGVEPSAGPGLVFVVLPTIFDTLPMGSVFAVAFYALLAIAALTSTISLLEVVVSYFVDERGWARERASWVVGVACLFLAIPSALSQGASEFLSTFLGQGLDFLSVQSIIFGNYSLSIGALLICVFVGWRWGVPAALEALEQGGHRLPAGGVWGLLVRFACPLAVLLVLGYVIWTKQYF
jgi:NSS family neurotransmitter:Na+ symporter